MVKIMLAATVLLVSIVSVPPDAPYSPADTTTYAVADDNSCCRKP